MLPKVMSGSLFYEVRAILAHDGQASDKAVKAAEAGNVGNAGEGG